MTKEAAVIGTTATEKTQPRSLKAKPPARIPPPTVMMAVLTNDTARAAPMDRRIIRSPKPANAQAERPAKPDRSSLLLCDHREDSRQRLNLAGRLKPACSLPGCPQFVLMQ